MSENNKNNPDSQIILQLNQILPTELNSSNISEERIDQIISRLEKAIQKMDILSSLPENASVKSEEKGSSSPLTK